jgi:hypothetical protein
VNSVHHCCISLNLTRGAGPCVPCPPESHHFPPLFLSHFLHCHWAPRSQKCHLPLLVRIILLLTRFWTELNRKNGKRVKRRRNFANNIPLESSQRGEHSRIIYFRFHTLCITRIRGERDSDLEFNWMIWQVIGQIGGLGRLKWVPRCC